VSDVPIVSGDRPADSRVVSVTATADERRERIGWPRAIASGLAVVLVAVAAGVYAPDRLLTGLSGLSRDARVYLATGVTLLTVSILAWALRRLQARGRV
jgi:hypothetical protein